MRLILGLDSASGGRVTMGGKAHRDLPVPLRRALHGVGDGGHSPASPPGRGVRSGHRQPATRRHGPRRQPHALRRGPDAGGRGGRAGDLGGVRQRHHPYDVRGRPPPVHRVRGQGDTGGGRDVRPRAALLRGRLPGRGRDAAGGATPPARSPR
ncbi:hypothetical protein [Streptomyces sp. CB00316]|uniref:hypothetical protein n=1 Tax=Streptomyces sp. CB00316 TaxID=1703932 RepID=UPI000B0646ED